MKKKSIATLLLALTLALLMLTGCTGGKGPVSAKTAGKSDRVAITMYM